MTPFYCEATNCESNEDSDCMCSRVVLDSNGCCKNIAIQTQKAKAEVI